MPCMVNYSPLSIESPTKSNIIKETMPAINRVGLKPDIKGPKINVATQILLMSRMVLARFSRWRLVNFTS